MDASALSLADILLDHITKPLTIAQFLLFLLLGYTLFSIGGHRGLRLRWLAWLPIGQDYVLGAIADDIGGQGRFFRGGESYYRHILAMIRIFSYFYTGLSLYLTVRGISLSGLLAGMGASYELISPIVSFLITAIQAAVLYKIFGYYRPDRASIYALLCLFFSFLTPFLLLSIRKSYTTRRPRRDWTQTSERDREEPPRYPGEDNDSFRG